MNMPPNLPRLFVGDGQTKFKGPAMWWSGEKWMKAEGNFWGMFAKDNQYALPPLRKARKVSCAVNGLAIPFRIRKVKRVSVEDAATRYSLEAIQQEAFKAGAKWMKRRGGK
jgi:hypothetical protein